MRTRVVPAREITSARGLRAESYVSEPHRVSKGSSAAELEKSDNLVIKTLVARSKLTPVQQALVSRWYNNLTDGTIAPWEQNAATGLVRRGLASCSFGSHHGRTVTHYDLTAKGLSQLFGKKVG